jgi:hypothetical protein
VDYGSKDGSNQALLRTISFAYDYFDSGEGSGYKNDQSSWYYHIKRSPEVLVNVNDPNGGVGPPLRRADDPERVKGPFSGFTLFGEKAFVIGKEAIQDLGELTKTVLHELFRLKNSAAKGGKTSQDLITKETRDAATFADEAYEAAFKNN